MSDVGDAGWLARRVQVTSARGIASSVAELIRSGELSPGDALPHVRSLASELRVSPATVSAAWALLKKRGLALGHGRSGTRVSSPVGLSASIEPAATIPPRADLRLLYPDKELLPPLRPALANAADLPGLEVYYDSPILPGLREVVEPEWPYAAEAFAVANGASDALWSVLQPLSVPGDRIVVESPTQPQLLHLMSHLGLSVIGVDVDENGPSPDQLRSALATRPVAVFTQPRAHVPTGASTTVERARTIAGLLERRTETMVIEYDERKAVVGDAMVSIGSYLPERTVHIKSFEKSHGPDLRLAVIGAASSRLDYIHSHMRLTRQWTSRILQSALAWLLQDPATIEHVAAARAAYADRQSTLCGDLNEHGVQIQPHPSFCVWLPVANEQRAVEYLNAHGVMVLAGASSYVAGGDPHIRIATSRLAPDESRRLAPVLSAATRVR